MIPNFIPFDPQQLIPELPSSLSVLSSRSYAARLSFYKLKQFQCEVTGKSGLNYFQALESEQQEARTLHTRFPQHLKAPVLRAVQWRTCQVLRFQLSSTFGMDF